MRTRWLFQKLGVLFGFVFTITDLLFGVRINPLIFGNSQISNSEKRGLRP